METTLDPILARHCGAVLMKRKAAAMVTLPRALRGELRRIKEMSAGEILCMVLKARPENDLVLIYRPDLLRAALGRTGAKELLGRHGYPTGSDLPFMLAHLKRRIALSEEFPHEVGLFLGYPIEDVEGFIANKGSNYKLSGDWKVYGDAQRAEALFKEYRDCREHMLSRLQQNGQIDRLCLVL